MRIILSEDLLDAESRRLVDAANTLTQSISGIKRALDLPGLPGYVGESRAAVTEARHEIAAVLDAANLLRARALLARLAAGGGMGMLKLRMDQVEYTNTPAFIDALNGMVKGMVMSEAGNRGAGYLARQIAKAFEHPGWRLNDTQIRKIERNLMKSDAKLYKQYKGMTRQGVEAMLAFDKSLAAGGRGAAAIANAYGPKGRLGPAGLSVAVDLLLQWHQDRGQTFAPGDRAKRLAVTGGLSVGAAGIALIACPETAGGGCLVAAGIILGTGANYAAGQINERWKSEEQKAAEAARKRYEKYLEQVRKLEQWYIDNGRPTESYMQERLEGAKEEYMYIGSEQVTIYRRPGDSEILARKWTHPGGEVEWEYVDTRGQIVKPR